MTSPIPIPEEKEQSSTINEKQMEKELFSNRLSPLPTVSMPPDTKPRKIMIVLRGPPGCGKSTFASTLLGLENPSLSTAHRSSLRKFHVCSTDDYFLHSTPLPPLSSSPSGLLLEEEKLNQQIQPFDEEEKTTPNINETKERKTNPTNNNNSNNNNNNNNNNEAKSRKRKFPLFFSLQRQIYQQPIEEKYSFDPQMLGFYHQQNQLRVRNQMLLQVSPLIIDNTNITGSAIKPYVLLADEFAYETLIVNPEDFTNEESNPILNSHTRKFNRQLLYDRASIRASNGSGKTIPLSLVDHMIDGFEANPSLTVDEIRHAEDFVPTKKSKKGPNPMVEEKKNTQEEEH